jgi:hypothetical protein
MMPNFTNPNLKLLEAVVARLGSLVDEVVFLGGCATGLLLSDPAAPPLRVTRDVDVMVEVATLSDYHKFNQKLRKRGFTEDTRPKAPICRWRAEDLVLDVMPTKPELLGFGNVWFARAFAAAFDYDLPSGARIHLLPAPYFLATKIAAFDQRGAGDYLLSRDIEDLVAILDGRPEILEELQVAENQLSDYLAERFAQWLKDPAFMDALPGLLPPDPASQARSAVILERMRAVSRPATS